MIFCGASHEMAVAATAYTPTAAREIANTFAATRYFLAISSTTETRRPISAPNVSSQAKSWISEPECMTIEYL